MSRIYDALKSAREFVAVNKLSPVASSDPLVLAPIHERRKQKRAGVGLTARVRADNPKDGNFEETLRTVNSSRGGLYCTTASQRYYPGMWVRVTFPFHSHHDSLTTSEDIGELLRVTPMPDGRFGLAILLRGPAHAQKQIGSKAHACGRTLGDRRIAARQSFTAAATILSTHAQTRLQARTADLSASGCYIDTMNPYAEGTRVQLQLVHGERVFETAARVRCTHAGMGMGVVFLNPAPDQKSILDDWLNQEPASFYSAG